jgi:hypothetical protein
MTLWQRSTLPNIITVGRIAMAPLVGLLLFVPTFTARFIAWLLFLIAAFSDLWDGHLARKYGWISEFGKLVDPIADKLLLASTFVPFYILSQRAADPARPARRHWRAAAVDHDRGVRPGTARHRDPLHRRQIRHGHPRRQQRQAEGSIPEYLRRHGHSLARHQQRRTQSRLGYTGLGVLAAVPRLRLPDFSRHCRVPHGLLTGRLPLAVAPPHHKSSMSGQPPGPPAVELLSIGNELLLGETVDTNATWIAARLAPKASPSSARRRSAMTSLIRDALRGALSRCGTLSAPAAWVRRRMT